MVILKIYMILVPKRPSKMLKLEDDAEAHIKSTEVKEDSGNLLKSAKVTRTVMLPTTSKRQGQSSEILLDDCRKLFSAHLCNNDDDKALKVGQIEAGQEEDNTDHIGIFGDSESAVTLIDFESKLNID